VRDVLFFFYYCFTDRQIVEECQHYDDFERIREREREWNKRLPKTPKITHRHSHGSSSGSGSPIIARGRQDSGFSDEASSKTSSLGSQKDRRFFV
jgi:hypothetical protein